jgi:toxin ParE1/3/4
MKLRWTRLAIHDLNAAYQYIAELDDAAAEQIVERIEVAVAALAHHPSIGRRGRVSGTRELVVTGTPFIVAYRLASGEVEILAVIHGSRMWPDRF